MLGEVAQLGLRFQAHCQGGDPGASGTRHLWVCPKGLLRLMIGTLVFFFPRHYLLYGNRDYEDLNKCFFFKAGAK